jgi:hypothetical protein
MVVDTTHCLVAGAILLGKEELNIVSWTGYQLSPHFVGITKQNKTTKETIERSELIKIIIK